MAITSAFQADEVGSIPTIRSKLILASVEINRFRSCSSGVEHTLGKGEVGGSIPPMSSKEFIEGRCVVRLPFLYVRYLN